MTSQTTVRKRALFTGWAERPATPYIAVMPPRQRMLSDHDRTAWEAYARHVRVLPGRQSPAPAPTPAAAPQAPASQTPPAPPGRPTRATLPPVVTGLPPPGLDRASWQRFSGGKHPPARTLDLHGRTAQAAFHALEHFLVTAHTDGLRVVEVITGRGAGEQGGVIRRELPHWLNLPRLRPLVLAASHPHARNAGSTRILLRRTR